MVACFGVFVLFVTLMNDNVKQSGNDAHFSVFIVHTKRCHIHIRN